MALLKKEYLFYLTLFISYGLYVFILNFPIVSLPFIQDDLGLTDGTIALIAARRTTGTSIGKLFTAFFLDMAGSFICLMLIFIVGFICMAILSGADTVLTISLVLAGVECVNGMAWPSHVTLIGNWWDDNNPKEKEIVDNAILILSLSSRFLSMAALSMYGFFLGSYSWRTVAYISCVMCGFGALWALTMVNDTQEKKMKFGEPVTPQKMIGLVKKVGSDPIFWVVQIVNSSTVVVRNLNALIATYLTNTTDMTQMQVVSLILCHPAGFVSGLLIIGNWYKTQTLSMQRKVVGAGYVGTFFVSMALINLPHGFVYQKVACIFLLTFFNAVPRYVVTTKFSIAYKPYTGFVSAFGQTCSYFATAQLYGLCASVLDSEYGWTGFWMVFLGTQMVGGSAAFYYQGVLAAKEKAKKKE